MSLDPRKTEKTWCPIGNRSVSSERHASQCTSGGILQVRSPAERTGLPLKRFRIVIHNESEPQNQERSLHCCEWYRLRDRARTSHDIVADFVQLALLSMSK